MIANQFPPMGGSGVQRSTKFVKFLRTFGYEPVVLTKARLTAGDESLLEDLPKGIELIATKGIDFDSKRGFLSLPYKLLARKVLVPDSEILWANKAYDVAFNRLIKGDIQVIYSTSFPYSDHLLALNLKGMFPQIPWVADFRDEWTKNPYILDMNYPEKRMKREKSMELDVLENVDALVTNTDAMLDGFLDIVPSLRPNSFVIPNGFDDADFQDATGKPALDKFVLTYAGSMYGRRKPDLILKALKALIDEGKIDSQKVTVEFIGNMKKEQVLELSRSLGLESIVSIHSYMKHRELLKKLSESACLLLLIGQGVGAENFSSGKIFEYIKLGRKILAAVPPAGEAAKIIRETNTGVIADCADIQDIKSALYKLYVDFFAGDVYPHTDELALEKYHRKKQTENLAQIFDKLILEREYSNSQEGA